MALEVTWTALPELPRWSCDVLITSTCLLESTTIALPADTVPADTPLIVPAIASVISLLPTITLLDLIGTYEGILTCPAVVPSSFVFITAKWSFDSSQINPTLVSLPLLIIRPESTLPTVADEERTINGSWTVTFWVLTVVVVPLTVKLPDTTRLPPAVMLLSPKLIVPLESFIEPAPILMVPTVTLPESSEVALTSPLVPYTTAFPLTTVSATAPSKRLISSLFAVTPSRILISSVVTVAPSNKLSSSAVEVTWVLDNLRVLVSTVVLLTVPAIATELLDKVIKSWSPENPMLELFITISSISNLPPDNVSDVVIDSLVLIVPNPIPILPVLKFPPWFWLPVDEAAKAASASALVYLSLNCVWILDVTPAKYPNSSAVVVRPSNLLRSLASAVNPVIALILAAVAVISVPESCNLLALISPFAPYTTALLLTIVEAAAPARIFNSSLVAVTPTRILSSLVVTVAPSRIFNSSLVAVTPLSALSSSGVAVISVPPTNNLVAFTFPFTVNTPLDILNKSVSPDTPIVDPETTTLSTSSSPAVTFPVVVIVLEPVSIDPNPAVIEPALSAPTVVIVLTPSLGAYRLAISELLNLLSSCVWIGPDTPTKWLICAVDANTPSNLLISAGVAVISTPETCNLDALTSPLVP